ncbi:MAG TPA: hypothetical protein VI752_01045 [Candidatus Paceibacterota bacterium]
MPDQEFSHIDELQKTLYSKTVKPAPILRSELRPRMTRIKKSWQIRQENVDGSNASQGSFLSKLLIITFLFFLVSISVAMYVLWQGGSSISSQNINFDIKGPVAVSAGDETALQIVIANNNSVELENVRLSLEFPSTTKSASSTREDLIRYREDIGNIESGSLVNKTVKAIFFGNENEDQTIKGVIEYSMAGSNALYTKATDLSFSITSPPVDLAVSLPKEVVVGQEMSFGINLIPQSRDTLEPILVNVDYPSGFEFVKSTISPTFSNNKWLISRPVAGKEEKITITGILSGQNGAEKTFRVSVGSQDAVVDSEIDFIFNEDVATLSLSEPFVGLSMSVGGKNDQTVVTTSGQSVPVVINYKNNLDTTLNDVLIKVKLDGGAFLPNTVEVDKGFYQSSNNEISWSKTTNSALASIAPGDSGSVAFNFKVPTISSGSNLSTGNPKVTLDASLNGVKGGSGFSKEPVETFIKTIVQVASNVNLSAESFYYNGPFQNSGPLPPKVGEETTYTVTWKITNPSNQLKDVLVKTTLPVYVDWKDTIAPTNELINFNSTSRELVWQVGQVKAGEDNRTVSFLLGLKPSLSQENLVPNLTEEAVLSGFDTFTETVLNNEARAVNIRTQSDSNYNSRNSVVTP